MAAGAGVHAAVASVAVAGLCFAGCCFLTAVGGCCLPSAGEQLPFFEDYLTVAAVLLRLERHAAALVL